MKKILNSKNLFLIPIVLTMIVSIVHVIKWYNMTNPLSWAIFMSISIEIGAMTSIIAKNNKINSGIWFMFGLVTFIQLMGNIFYSYNEIDINSDLFKSWVELTGPIFESLGSDITDIIAQKRWLAFLEGGLLPIISLTSLHFFIKYKPNEEQETTKEIIVEKEVPVEIIKEIPVTVEKIIEKEVPVEKIVEKIVEKEVPVEVIKEVVVEKPIYLEQQLTDEEIINRFREIASEQNEDHSNRKLIYTK